ncbi:MAG TPA: hypothetical protein VFP50_13820, partial [Anaeromyxobacteraceae bacterium]|nr:hypothetical protein [Anaeromyxobacteraceae bacterium]
RGQREAGATAGWSAMVTAAVFPGASRTSAAPARPSAVRTVSRTGSGVSPTALVGVELDPWSPFGIRAGLGMVTSVGGGEWTSAELTAALVYRPLRAAALSPYLTAGVQLATLTIAPQDHSFGPPLARSTISLAAAAPGGDPEAAPSANTSPSGPVHYSVAPELGAGLGLPLVEGLALDVGVRYLPLRWEGEVRHAFTGVVAVCSPF